ncbi:RNA-binding protein 4-like isoform X2 [Styela clava]|uniref:RNA-binding protein 4-like isoform X2 n=1 Tax=Styela clava TaxID=7725 RepID=UPI00193A6CA6|nr:RNA-binding protein 4-like isoform X2 [Styela clava]
MKIFVGNLPSDCARADIIDLFEKYGSVKDCDIIKNYAFVQMDDEDDAKDAIESLSKSKFMGNDLTVEESTSRPRNTQKLYVGNLSSATSRRDLEKMFDKYGDVTSCDIIKDYAFVHMAKERDAEKAIRDLHGVTVDGRKLIVDFSRSESERRGLGRYGSGGGRGYRDYNDRQFTVPNGQHGVFIVVFLSSDHFSSSLNVHLLFVVSSFLSERFLPQTLSSVSLRLLVEQSRVS